MTTKDKKIYLTENLRYLLKTHSLSVLELADKIGDISYETLARIRRDESCNPTLKNIVGLSNYFEINVGDLLFKNIAISNRTDKDSQCQRIPIADWDNFNDLPNSKKYLNVEIKGNNLFALYVENDIGDIAKDSYIIVNPKAVTKNNDYVLIENQDSKTIFIRRLIKDQVFYLESLLIDKNIVEFNPEDNKILGVIIGYQKLKLFS